MVTRWFARTGNGLRAFATPGIAVLAAAAFLGSGCAAHGAPVKVLALEDAQRAACEDFARGEVWRLGEFVPAALAKGFLVGLAVDVSQILDLVAISYRGDHLGASIERQWMERPWTEHQWAERLWPEDQRYWLPGPAVRFDGAPFPASVVGGPLLARDAARTNDDVYAQAIEKCVAPARLAREFGPGDARVAASLDTLADAYVRQREYARAEPLRREAASIWTALFGPTDSKVARALDDHAAALRGVHRNAEADSLTARAAEIRAKLGAFKAQPPADGHKPAIRHSCDSPVHAALFTLCRHAPPPPDHDLPVIAARP
jgi:hypothetical protein